MLEMNNSIELSIEELACIDAGSGPWSSVLLGLTGGLSLGNALAIAALWGPGFGVAAAVGGGYCIYKLID
ncbi:hypothetical protein NNC19_20565 [Clostridium sp. SHJSY1]|uniref:hypothetical protein n=1 Tax=Clostridium sp. SHJSY1 TaxID=2942483 RepID=UPI00287418C8|nr:hypothetical protein [Clostridium sp. SHJSY1]MDS0528092.1 hypothetical protein [Clostridium sp. SHJSY1]